MFLANERGALHSSSSKRSATDPHQDKKSFKMRVMVALSVLISLGALSQVGASVTTDATYNMLLSDTLPGEELWCSFMIVGAQSPSLF